MVENMLFGQGQSEVFDEIMQSMSVFIEDFIENTDGAEELDFNTLTENLFLIYQNPLDLNSASSEDFSELLFLTELEITGIIDYRNQYGDFLSPYEVQTVPSLTRSKARFLMPFVTVEVDAFNQPKVKVEGLGVNRNELFLKTRNVLEKRAGFKSDGSTAPKYLGSPTYFYTRFLHTNDNNWRAGFTIEKDEGESFVSANSTTGLDYISAFIEKRAVSPLVKQINIGDYNVNLGQGLISHTSFGLGKSSYTTQVLKAGRKLKHYSSVIENRALRGVAALFEPSKNIESLLFASYESRDGNLLSEDANGVVNISSLQTSGLHRTEGEIKDQDAVNELTAGGNINWKNKRINIGLNTVHHFFDRDLIRSTTPFRIFQWRGNSLSNYSLDYKIILEGFNFFGESAYSSNGGWAHMHGLLKGLDPKLDVAVIYRNYDPEYQALFANSFGESNLANNERGVYLGLKYRPSSKVEIRAYTDYWKTPWIRSRTEGPGIGQEYLIRADYTPKRGNNYYILYRYEEKDENTTEVTRIDRPIRKRTQRLRLHATYKLSNNLTMKSRLEGSLYHKGNETESGILAYQDVIIRSIDSPFSLSSRFSYFNISDFDARIYAYENDLLYEYYIPAFSGNGLRYYLKMRYDVNSRIMVETRLEQTRYFDRSTVGSGNSQIEGNTFSRIKAQVRIRL